MHLTVLGSGSGGNSALISEGTTRLLVDAGLSASQLQSRLQSVGVEPETLTAILLTHEHGDHVRGLEVFTKKFPIPIYCTALTRQVVQETFKSDLERRWKIIQAGQLFPLQSWEISSFPVPHDAVEPLGYTIRSGPRPLGILSDVGHLTRTIREKLHGVHTLFVEANYDADLLQEDRKRPFSTKQRISSAHGHLSNDQSVQLIADLAHPELERIVLGHLSSDCNQPKLVMKMIRERLALLGYTELEILCATQDTPTATMPVRERLPSVEGSTMLIQPELF